MNDEKVVIDGVYCAENGEKLYMEYCLYFSEGNVDDISKLKDILYSYIAKTVSEHDLDYLFPIGTGKTELDFERHIFEMAQFFVGIAPDRWAKMPRQCKQLGLCVGLTKGAITRYAMPDRLMSYKNMSITELCAAFGCNRMPRMHGRKYL